MVIEERTTERPLLAVAEIYEAGSRSEAPRIGGVMLQIVREWVIRFNACCPDGLLGGKARGQAMILNDPAPGAGRGR